MLFIFLGRLLLTAATFPISAYRKKLSEPNETTYVSEMVATKKTSVKRASAKKSSKKSRWSKHVTEHSDAMTLEPGVFSHANPKQISRSIKRSAQRSKRRKSSPYRSAISMVTFFLNRAGNTLNVTRRKKIEAAKIELRRLFDKPAASTKTKTAANNKRKSTSNRPSKRSSRT